MTAPSRERAAELAALLARHSDQPPHLIARHVLHLQRIARQAVTAETNLCNVPDYQPVRDARIAKLRERAAGLVKALEIAGAGGRIGGDPRGACCWIFIPGARGDGFEGPGWYAVY